LALGREGYYATMRYARIHLRHPLVVIYNQANLQHEPSLTETIPYGPIQHMLHFWCNILDSQGRPIYQFTFL